jgi:hypothetical protein
MHRANANISGPRFLFTISFMAASSWADTAGIPASILWIPTSANFSAMAIFWSLLNINPACCSPSLNVTSWSFTFFAKLKSFVTSSAKFQGLVNHLSVFQGVG